MRLNISRVEAELLRDALVLWQETLVDNYVSSEAYKATGRYASRRLKELLAKIEPLCTDAGAK